MQKKDDSRMVLAIILIAAGLLWLFRQAGQFPFFTNFPLHHFFIPFRHMFAGIGNILFSWQAFLILTGIVLIAGRRSAGIVVVVLGSIMLLPELLHFSYWSLSFLLPTLLIGVGVVMILKASLKIN